jgi:hypothetical protein
MSYFLKYIQAAKTTKTTVMIQSPSLFPPFSAMPEFYP